MFSQIQNPETGKWVNVNGKVGKKVLNNYVNHLDLFSIGGGLLNSITQFLDSFSSNKKNDQVNSEQVNSEQVNSDQVNSDQVNSDQVNSEPIKTTYQQKIEPGSNILPSQNYNSAPDNPEKESGKNYKIAG